MDLAVDYARKNAHTSMYTAIKILNIALRMTYRRLAATLERDAICSMTMGLETMGYFMRLAWRIMCCLLCVICCDL